MKILFVSERFYPKLRGGEVMLWRVAQGLTQRGHQVQVVTPRLEGTDSHEVVKGIEIFRPLEAIHGKSDSFRKIISKGIFILNLFRRLKQFVKEMRPDVIFNLAYTVTLPCGAVGRKFNIPVITNIGILRATDYLNSGEQSALTRLHGLKERCVLRFGGHQAIRVASKSVAQKITPFTNARIYAIPSPIDDRTIRSIRENTDRQAVRNEFDIDEVELFLLFVGGLEPVKNVDALIDILSEVNRPFKFVLVGGGSQEHSLRQKVSRLGLEEKVILKGRKPQKRVFELMRAADALLLGSKSEVLPTVILEALSVGTPVITTDVGGVKDIKSCNLTVVDRIEEIKDQIERGFRRYDDSKVLEEYSMNKIAGKFESMFRQVAGGDGR